MRSREYIAEYAKANRKQSFRNSLQRKADPGWEHLHLHRPKPHLLRPIYPSHNAKLNRSFHRSAHPSTSHPVSPPYTQTSPSPASHSPCYATRTTTGSAPRARSHLVSASSFSRPGAARTPSTGRARATRAGTRACSRAGLAWAHRGSTRWSCVGTFRLRARALQRLGGSGRGGRAPLGLLRLERGTRTEIGIG